MPVVYICGNYPQLLLATGRLGFIYFVSDNASNKNTIGIVYTDEAGGQNLGVFTSAGYQIL